MQKSSKASEPSQVTKIPNIQYRESEQSPVQSHKHGAGSSPKEALPYFQEEEQVYCNAPSFRAHGQMPRIVRHDQAEPQRKILYQTVTDQSGNLLKKTVHQSYSISPFQQSKLMNTYETEEKQDSELTDDAKLVRGWKNSSEDISQMDLNMSRS